MASKKTFTFVLMDPPYESANSTTAFRLIDAAIKRDLQSAQPQTNTSTIFALPAG